MLKCFSQITLPIKVEKNILLDILKLKDKKELFKLIKSNRKHLQKYMPWIKECKKIDDVPIDIEVSLEKPEFYKSIRFGIYYSQELIGSILLTPFREDNSFEIGYWISKPFQGRGIVTKSCFTLLKTISKGFPSKHAIIRCSANNIKSQAVAKRLGFVPQESSLNRKGLSNIDTDIITYCKALP